MAMKSDEGRNASMGWRISFLFKEEMVRSSKKKDLISKKKVGRPRQELNP